MRNSASLFMFFLAVSIGCTSEPPEDGVGSSAVPDGADGSDFRDGSIRILSDVAPGQTDGSKGRGGAGGTEARDAAAADVERDARGGGSADDAAPPSDAARPNDAATDRRANVDARGNDVAAPSLDVAGDTARDARAADGDGASTDVRATDVGAGDVGHGVDVSREMDAPGARDAFAVDGDAGVDACSDCPTAADHLLITEVVTRPAGTEFIEISNPTPLPIALSDYLLSDSHLYYEVAAGGFTTASGSDFAARFPEGAVLESGQYAVVALGNASGGTQSFAATYGKLPDFELRPTANQAADDPAVPNMVAVGASIGANASLTDGGEPVVLFAYRDGDVVVDVDYVFYGTPSSSNPMVDKSGIVAGAWMYLADTPPSAQHPATAPGEMGSIHRCSSAEFHETAVQGNGIGGHDETSEDLSVAFRVGTNIAERTPGGPPGASVCVTDVPDAAQALTRTR